jgi:hypothetical protein
VHGFKGCLQYVDAVYFFMVYYTYCPRQGFAFYYRAQFYAVLFSYLLAVIEQGMPECGRKYYSGGKDRACEASSPRFIATRLYQPFFVKFFHRLAFSGKIKEKLGKKMSLYR